MFVNDKHQLTTEPTSKRFTFDPPQECGVGIGIDIEGPLFTARDDIPLCRIVEIGLDCGEDSDAFFTENELVAVPPKKIVSCGGSVRVSLPNEA